jgi:hypothetical protein
VTDGSETTTRRTRVFVADGHANYREGMTRLLGAHTRPSTWSATPPTGPPRWHGAAPGTLVAELVAAGEGRVGRAVE